MSPLHLAVARPLCLLERPTGAIHCFRNRKTFERSLVLFKGFLLSFQKSFFCLSAWRSSIIPHLPPSVNTFRQVFSVFFAIHSGVRKSTRFECPPLRAGHLQRQLLLSLQPAQNGPFTIWAVMTGSRCGPVPDFPI